MTTLNTQELFSDPQPDPRRAGAVELPSFGIHFGIPEAEYHAWPAVNQSALKQARRSMRHVLAALEEHTEPTPAMAFGSAFHAAAFGDENAVVVSPGFGRSKADIEAKEKFYLENAGRHIVKCDERVQIDAMIGAMVQHPAVPEIFEGLIGSEISILWRDKATGLACKARLDALSQRSDGTLVIVDLKSVQDAAPEKFGRDIHNYGYHYQIPWYERALRLAWSAQHGIAASSLSVESLMLCVEKSTPHATAIYRLPPRLVYTADEQMMLWLAQYAGCVDLEEFPGYSPDIEEIDIPGWAYALMDGGDS